MEDKLEICSFCDKHVDEVAKLVVATKAAICNECIEICSDITTDDTKQDQFKED